MNFDELKANFVAKKQSKNTVGYCLNSVSEYLDIPIGSIVSKSRKSPLVIARMYFFFTSRYIIDSNLNDSYAYLGSLLNKDHSTVINSINKFKDLYLTDKNFAKEYQTFISGVYGLDGFNKLNNLKIN